MNALTDPRRTWNWVALVAIASTPSFAAESFTIEEVMSAPYPTALVAATRADRDRLDGERARRSQPLDGRGAAVRARAPGFL